MAGTLMSVGYATAGALQQLEEWMSNADTLLIDVRLRPRSRWYPQWNKKALRARWQGRYTHEHRLGNVNYRDKSQPIQLQGPQVEEVIAFASHVLHEGWNLVLLCACADYETCHRKLVAEMIEQRVKATTCPHCGGELTPDFFGEVCVVDGEVVCSLCDMEWHVTQRDSREGEGGRRGA